MIWIGIPLLLCGVGSLIIGWILGGYAWSIAWSPGCILTFFGIMALKER